MQGKSRRTVPNLEAIGGKWVRQITDSYRTWSSLCREGVVPLSAAQTGRFDERKPAKKIRKTSAGCD
jgi:hypothetical protein